ncbi:hypothetical protein A2459_04365 [Candidatus Roizmanbacteria bacterium RIFOXYC2_FULL_41_10]|nr:MAG: hypothetical protein A2459_04365 [Candidatus Roizmanbacteria bacterium RIFOXYC2_FULL_41_10]
MKIVVAGGAGFIGSHLCEYLLTKSHEVICLDNLLTGNKKNLKNALKYKQFRFIKTDVTHKLPEDLGKIDAVFHLASPASPNLNSPISYHTLAMETMLVNTQGTLNLLNLAHSNKARFLFASSSEVYGDPQVNPQPESYRGNVSTTGQRSVYDEAKRFGETLTSYFVRKKNLDARIARIFNTYGPRILPQDGRMLTNFILQALSSKPITLYGKGEQTRSLCYVSDTVMGLTSLMFIDNLAGEIVNIGTTKEHMVKEYAKMVKELTHSNSQIVSTEKLPQDDPLVRRPDINKASTLLNWFPKVKLPQGITETINYYRHA